MHRSVRDPLRFLMLFVMIFGNNACASTQSTFVASTAVIPQATGTDVVRPSASCKPALDDGVSPSYKPNAPERAVVGQGHILTGVVRSSADCQPIANAKLEFWPEETGLGHPDDSRATVFTNESGEYRFECNPPEHIHMRISAPGYRTIGVNSYHPEGRAEGSFDIMLEPES